MKIVFKSNKRANEYKAKKILGTENQTFVVYEKYASFKEYSEAITQALNTKGLEIEIKGGKTVNNITKAYELYDYVLVAEYNSFLNFTEYKQIFMKNPEIGFKKGSLVFLDGGKKYAKYPLVNYRRALALATSVIEGTKSMDILVEFVNNHADKDLDGIVFPTVYNTPEELLNKVCKILDLSEIPEPETYYAGV